MSSGKRDDGIREVAEELAEEWWNRLKAQQGISCPEGAD